MVSGILSQEESSLLSGVHPALAALAVPLVNLTPLPGNPRQGDVDAVARSSAAFGQRKPLVARRIGEHAGKPAGIVIAGNHQLIAARELGWSEVAVVWVDDDELTAKAFALADNRTADLGTYDDEALAELLREVSADEDLLFATSFSEDDLASLLAGTTAQQGYTDPDAVPDPPLEPVTRPGDLWLLGPHRLLCGDATVHADVQRLMAGERAVLMAPTRRTWSTTTAAATRSPRSTGR
jgi:ParB-like nuclease family protein